jgi:large subunit ribosomal protein L21
MKDSFVVIKKGGVQHIVSEGDEIVINRIEGDKGSEIKIDDVFLYQDNKDTVVGTPTTGHTVTAEIMRQFKGPKMHVRTYNAKARYRRKKGHRQLLTRLKIKKIAKGNSSSKDKKSKSKSSKK